MKEIALEIALTAVGVVIGLAAGLQLSRLIGKAGIPIAVDRPQRVPLT